MMCRPAKKTVAFRAQFAAQLAVIIDAAVEHDRQPELGIDHRLLRRNVEIDDAEPAMSERNAIL